MTTAPTPSNRQLYEPGNQEETDLLVEQVSVDPAAMGHCGARLIGPDGHEIELSADLYRLLESVARQVRRGNAVQVVTYTRDLTTQQAAEILNVSRQYLVRLLERGEIPHTKTEGSHRRLRLQDVLDYRRRRSEQRRASLDRLARASAEMGDYE